MKVYFDQMSETFSLTQKNAILFLEDSIDFFESNDWTTANGSPYIEDYGKYINKLPKGFEFPDVYLTSLYDNLNFKSLSVKDWNYALDEVKRL